MNGSAWGGSEELWYKLALYTASKGIKTGVVCFNWPEKQNKLTALRNAGCNLYLLQRRRSVIAKIKNRFILNNIPVHLYEIQIVNQGGWEDVTHAPFKYFYKKLSNYILLFHNYEKGARLQASKKQILKNWTKHAQLNAAASSEVFHTLQQEYEVFVERKEVFINPITFLPLQVVTTYPNQNDPAIWVILAALDVGRKAQDIMIATLSAVKWKERNWQLHIYGNGKDQAFLEKFILEKGLEQKVFLKGHTNNVAEVLKYAHWLFQCTHKDAMPISVMEAMAIGRPCLVSNIGDMPEWIKDGESGYVCASVTQSAIDEKLEILWQNKERWQQMGEAAYARFVKKYPQPFEAVMFNKIMNAL